MQTLSPLPDPLQLLPGLIKGVQHGGEGIPGRTLHGAAVLIDGDIGEIGGLAVPDKHPGGEAPPVLPAHCLLPHRKGCRQVLPVRCVPYMFPVPAACRGQLPAYQRGQPIETVQQPLGGVRPVGDGGQHVSEVLRTGRQRVQLFLGRREVVEKAGEDLTLLAHLHVHTAQAVDDPLLTVQKDQVGVPAHALEHQPSPPRLPQLVHDIQGQDHHPLQARLIDGRQPAAGQMLAQEHTEHGRRGGVFPGQAGEVQPGLTGPGAQQQLLISPQGQDDLVPGGLLDLVHPKARQLGPQLLYNGL